MTSTLSFCGWNNLRKSKSLSRTKMTLWKNSSSIFLVISYLLFVYFQVHRKHIQKVKSFADQLGKDMNNKWECEGYEGAGMSVLLIKKVEWSSWNRGDSIKSHDFNWQLFF